MPKYSMYSPSKYIATFMLIAGSCFMAFSQTVTTQVFSTSGTFTVPQCVTTITVQCWGGGGGGGGASEADGGAAGSGGGGGGYATAVLTNVSGTYTVTVGAAGTAGTGGASTATNGGPGGSSIFTNGTVTVTGQGGTGGTGSTGGVGTTVGQGGGGTFAGGVTGTTYKGGNGALGNNDDNNTGGAGGGGAGSSGNGVTPAQTGDDDNGTGGAGGTGNPNGEGGSVSAEYYENGGNGTSIGGGGAGGGGETSGGIFGHGTAAGNGGTGAAGEVIVSYSVSTPTITSVTGTGCPGSTVTINGTLLSGATSVTINSTALTNLSITSTKITGTIAAGTTTGLVKVITPCGTVTSAADFTVHAISTVNLGSHTICSGSYTFGGHTYSTSGTYSDTTSSAVTGCDSITTITLVIGTAVNRSISQLVCDGGTYNFGGHTYSASGTYMDTTTSAVTGCDSITTLTLTVTPPIYILISQTICGDSSYSFGGHTYTTSGLYTDTTSSVSGCDSITALRLAVNPVPTSTTVAYICTRSGYTFNGTTYTLAGTYADTLIAASVNGCDSIAKLNLGLAINPGEAVAVSATPPVICNGDTTQVCAVANFTATYLWNTSDTNACFYTTTASNYIVSATDTFGCLVTNNIVVAAYSSVSPTIQQDGDTLISSVATSYQWYYNNQPVTGDTGNYIIATQNGPYTVNVADTNGCPAKSTAFDYTTGIVDLKTGASITVYPNPLVSGNWRVNVSQVLVGSVYQLLDADGRSIFKATINNPHFEISADLAKGVYILQVGNTTSTYSLKLIKLY